MAVPLGERGGRLRGAVDLVTGQYPGFVFGGRVKDALPVFHFHEVAPEDLEGRFRYLADNGYRTVCSDAIARYVLDGVRPGPRAVTLCFDDACRSLWTVAAPLLRRYGFRAIAYAIPGRTAETPPANDPPFVTWPQLRALHDEGIVDVQSHTFSHSMVFASRRITGFVTPRYAREPLLSRPRIRAPDRGAPPLRFLDPGSLGAPLHPVRSRMSDGFRYLEDDALRRRLVEHVRREGGAAFFSRPGWRTELQLLAGPPGGRIESREERSGAIREELGRSREVLESRLRCRIRHLCFPWGVAGEVALRAARETGYRTAFADRWLGRRAVRPGDEPFRLMRLPNRYIFALPGEGRRLVPFFAHHA